MKVVIVGGGFGGIRLAIKLANKPEFEVKLISDKTYFEYHAALYRTVTGRSPLEVAIPLEEFFGFARNVEVVHDRIIKLDANKQKLLGESKSVYQYDKVIFAIGSVTQYFGIKGLEEYSYGVKSVNEALELKRHLHEQLSRDGKEQNYVVVGGGATGVELSAELSQYLRYVRRRHHVNKSFTIDLIEAGPRVLAILPEAVSQRVSKRLKSLDINLIMNTAVKAETVQSIQLPRGSIKSHTVAWTAGVANNPFFKQYPRIFREQKGGKIIVNHHLEAAKNCYVIGDCAATQYSGMAQTAMADANFVAEDLMAIEYHDTRHNYIPHKPVYAIPVGKRWAAVVWGNFQMYGYLGWMVRRLVDMYLYLCFLPLHKAVRVWRFGVVNDESCSLCKNK